MMNTATHAPPLILVVEDEYLIRCVSADVLRAGGYRVIEAGSADEARDILTDGVPVDLVLSDVRMPGSIDGLQLLSWIRSDYPLIEVILCSGHFDPSAAIACGARAFIAKPFEINDLVHRVDACLEPEHGASLPALH